DALESRRNRVRERCGRQRLGDAGHAFEQDVTAAGAHLAARGRERDGGKQAGQQTTNKRVLTDDDLGNFRFERGDDRGRLLRRIVVRGRDSAWDCHTSRPTTAVAARATAMATG